MFLCVRHYCHRSHHFCSNIDPFIFCTRNHVDLQRKKEPKLNPDLIEVWVDGLWAVGWRSFFNSRCGENYWHIYIYIVWKLELHPPICMTITIATRWWKKLISEDHVAKRCLSAELHLLAHLDMNRPDQWNLLHLFEAIANRNPSFTPNYGVFQVCIKPQKMMFPQIHFNLT